MEENENPRELEKEQIQKLMNVVADKVYAGKYDPAIGTTRIENQIQKGGEVSEVHLCAFRLSREEILYAWLRLIGLTGSFPRQSLAASKALSIGKPFSSQERRRKINRFYLPGSI